MMGGFAAQIRSYERDTRFKSALKRWLRILLSAPIVLGSVAALPAQAQQADGIDCTAQASYLAVLALSASEPAERELWEALVLRYSGGSISVMGEAERLNMQRAPDHAALDASLGRRGGYEALSERIRLSCSHLGGL